MLRKNITLPNQTTGDVIRLRGHSVDYMRREASAQFYLYVNDAAPKNRPAWPSMIAKLRLNGDKFDQYLSSEALAAMENPGIDPVRTAFYRALKAEDFLAGGELRRDELDFSDAKDA